MNLQPNGQAYLGGGMQILPRDFLKMGQLFLDEGTWNGKRVLDAAWVRQAFAPHASLYAEGDYGYGWWRISYDVAGEQIPAYYASGNGGQLLFVIPQLDLVVLFHGGNYGNFGTWRSFRDDFLPNYILPAVGSN